MIGINCNTYNQHQARKREKEKSNNSLILSLIIENQTTSDCIYCDNTRAFSGNCTCYSSITVGTCNGKNSGQGKSNSIKVSCSELTSIGVWTQLNDETFYCNFTSCPPEAYRAAFTNDGR
ncbi:MAG: hypothetical protein H7A23_15560 [Leptospiraceae bacterium]|nr:hypothetical protein [Leptospiraceae bacterium]MCP5495967.1 hypothetical protein [Leptospiraceae bacterium]